MSPVVRDAIQVCSKLDIRYLWVDALCILQGNDDTAVEDWNHESQQMAKIFKSALVTLCAASSTSYSIDINYYRLDSFPFHKQIDASRWYGRGWVHQEMRLSSRLLVFTSDWLFFMCDGLYLCENGLSVTREWRTPLAVGTCKADMQEEPFAAFASEIETFTAKDFTFDTDRLPALASLASMIAANTGSQYLAGLWRDNLDKDLLFARNVPRYGTRGMVSFQKRIAALSAPGSVIRPSWSWAGLTGPCDAGPPSLTATTRLALQCEVAHARSLSPASRTENRPIFSMGSWPHTSTNMFRAGWV
ncbi:hypothetical protein M406DRAFT_330495 [Cryphonectria parasitica EP155]|uniref:Heterokaryon incompatibility domain-containing protein n=1 Tax=Cryphonectria parasitica (strain ATCC 38755 / EP155) TaxID=660469 RepID=A0A9P4Y091_CRYP1|nr:uncharacterized protein M406DRAFT_330495 [Cryphonectria parasitica EP155]KAF3764144.1 hypothetical protein M406DRAFT_330495 [Cryphonectria parasitica EP155]